MKFRRPGMVVAYIAFCACVHMLKLCVHILHKNPKFNCNFGQTSNGHNELNINPSHAKFIFKLKPIMFTLQ